ncbi:cytochrome c oxidase assembly protein [Exiguobacterium mexicanum]|uniref:Cytochrome c oxidase assembly protein n=1 Tax=Exiguobacterium mexicanum TaxID=340146 RepID=A0ABT7MKJ6_9BACL|nr:MULTISPECIES: cytochrome c oxidase assembly protein [Exiguobacterium]MDL5375765.1 cytochrome c oxidase assembly protein [Exiguobacterium mexicanum]
MLWNTSELLKQFDWMTLWSPWFGLLMVGLYVLYAVVTEKMAKRGYESTTLLQKFSMLSAILLYYIGFGSPVDVLAHIIFSVHMLQMVLVYVLAPALVVYGMPYWVFEKLFSYKVIGPTLKFMTKPLIALVLFNALFTFYHMPFIFDYVLTNYGVHRIFHGALVVFSLTMWYPVIAPFLSEEEEGMSDLKRMVYIIANGVLLTPACAFIIFSQGILYDAYTDAETFATVLGYCMPNGDVSGLDLNALMGATNSALEDQRFGGVLMKLGQEVVYGFFFGWTFFGWVRRTKSLAIDEGMSFTPQEPKEKK